MATKDIIYLALIVMAGVVFYFQGYLTGLMDAGFRSKPFRSALPPPQPTPAEEPEEWITDHPRLRWTDRPTLVPPERIRGDFGNN